jgi:hypothetical protein
MNPTSEYTFGDSFFEALENIIITDDNIDFFIGILLAADDFSVRNQLALKISDTGNPKLIEPLVSLIKDPKTFNHRGSLISALEQYDYLPYMDLLVSIINENFEVRWSVDTMQRESMDSLSEEQKKRYSDIISKEAEECEYALDILSSLADDLSKGL